MAVARVGAPRPRLPAVPRLAPRQGGGRARRCGRADARGASAPATPGIRRPTTDGRVRRRRRGARPPSSAPTSRDATPAAYPATPQRLPCPVTTATTGTRYASANNPATATLPTTPAVRRPQPPRIPGVHLRGPAIHPARRQRPRRQHCRPRPRSTQRPRQREILRDARRDRTVAADPPVRPGVDDQELPARHRRRRPQAAVRDGHRQRRRPRPCQQRLDRSLGPRARDLHRPRRQQPRSRRPQRTDGRASASGDSRTSASTNTRTPSAAAAASTNRAHAHCLPTHPAGGPPTPRSTTNRGSSATAAAATSNVRSDESSSSTNTRIAGVRHAVRADRRATRPTRAASSRAGTNTATGSETTPPGARRRTDEPVDQRERRARSRPARRRPGPAPRRAVSAVPGGAGEGCGSCTPSRR